VSCGGVAALYDIHGNLPALEAVVADVHAAGVEQIVIGGDIVPGPMPRECLDLLLGLDLPVRFIAGNGEREVLACWRGNENPAIPEQFRDSMRWNADQLRPQDAGLLGRWPATLRLEIDGLGEVLFCHATPGNDSDIFTRATPESVLRPIFEPAGVPLVVCGHTHMQFHRRIGRTRVVNAGSVGMPFGKAGAYWVIIGTDVELRRTHYDLDRAAQRIRATAYSQAEDFATRYVLQPPTEERMLAAYARAELR
jgi:predicted phosphodiesterase